jgi:hypothetical protein
VFLTEAELKSTYYKKAATMDQDEVTLYLNQANAYAFGIVGGIPPAIPGDNGAGLKAAVALAFQLFAKADTAQVDEVTGNITEAAPAGAFVRNKEKDPWAIVDRMLKPYAEVYAASNVTKSDRGIQFL